MCALLLLARCQGRGPDITPPIAALDPENGSMIFGNLFRLSIKVYHVYKMATLSDLLWAD